MIVLELTDEEAVALRNLLNLAVLHSGMQVAEAALILDGKIRAAAQARALPAKEE